MAIRRSYAMVRSYGLKQELTTPHCVKQNGMIEWAIRTPKEQCAHRHCFDTLQDANCVVGHWVGFYNTWLVHPGLGTKTLAEGFALAESCVQIPMHYYVF